MTTTFALAIGISCVWTLAAAPEVQAQKAPVYKVDPSWPKMPLPNKWIIQGVPDLVVDKDDHIWVVSRPRDINAG